MVSPGIISPTFQDTVPSTNAPAWDAVTNEMCSGNSSLMIVSVDGILPVLCTLME